MASDINFNKLLFISLGCGNLISLISSHLFKEYMPHFLLNLSRYGKLADTQSSKLLNIPKYYFKHFYLVAAFIYTPIVLYEVSLVYLWKQDVPDWFKLILKTYCGSERHATTSTIHTCLAIILITLQIGRRFYDTHFVSVFSKQASAHFAHYVIGLWYYMGVYIIILSEAPKFAETHDVSFGAINWIDVGALILFFWAWYHQHTTTVILANLRKNNKGDVVTESYKIPQGDWFDYLSSPHYIAELLIYVSIWIILGIKHSWWTVCLMVFVNQIDSIINSHQWYKSQFKNFPKERKAIIPFIM